MGDTPGTDVDDAEVLAVFAEREDVFLRPTDVDDDLPIESEGLRDRFDDLSNRGLLGREEDRPGGTAWQLTAVGASAVETADVDVVTDVEAQATDTGTGSVARDQETPATPPPEPGQDTAGPPDELPRGAVESFDPPGTPEQKDERREAVRAARVYLRHEGRATRSDFVDDVFPVAPGAYESPTDGWWEEVVEPGLDFLPGPEPVDGGSAWRFDEAAVTEKE